MASNNIRHDGLTTALTTHPCSQVKKWRVAKLRVGDTGAAAEAQHYLLAHAERIRRLADLQAERRLRDRKRGRLQAARFSWVGPQELELV